MPPSSMQQLAHAGAIRCVAAQPCFGFPRIYLARRLQKKLMEQLHLGPQACELGRRNPDGRFHALGDEDDFDGPAFTLHLRQAAGGHEISGHDIDIELGILFGHYLLTVHGHRFEIAFLPTLDEALLATAARWIVRPS